MPKVETHLELTTAPEVESSDQDIAIREAVLILGVQTQFAGKVAPRRLRTWARTTLQEAGIEEDGACVGKAFRNLMDQGILRFVWGEAKVEIDPDAVENTDNAQI